MSSLRCVFVRQQAGAQHRHVKILPDSTEKDPKDTSDRVFNKVAWGHFNGTEGVLHACFKVLVIRLDCVRQCLVLVLVGVQIFKYACSTVVEDSVLLVLIF